MADVKSMSTDEAKKDQQTTRRQPQSISCDEELLTEMETHTSSSKPPWDLYETLSGTGKKKGKYSSWSDEDSDCEPDTKTSKALRPDKSSLARSQKPGRSTDEESSGFPCYPGQNVSEDDNEPRYGPRQAPQNKKAAQQSLDYAFDICQEYHDTGTCKLGDSCKLWHGKSDPKVGWQLDEWGLIDEEDIHNFEIYECEPTEDELPETCNVCREYFRDPVKSECDHYFCETCFKNPVWRRKRCPICAVNLHEYASVASDLMQHLKNKGASQIAVA